MGSTSNPQLTKRCPNCQGESIEAVGTPPEGDTVELWECHNENCSVDRFWGERDDE